MKRELLKLIVCPRCGAALELRDEEMRDGEVETGRLVCVDESYTYPVHAFVPRFVQSDDYADAFALEWNAFRTAHLDSFTGLDRLDSEFRSFPDFPIDAFEGKLVLDAGCGLGRFSEIVLNYGGRVVAVDIVGRSTLLAPTWRAVKTFTLFRQTSSGSRSDPRASTWRTAQECSTTLPILRPRSPAYLR